MEAKIKLAKAQRKIMDEINSYPRGHLRLFRRKGGRVLCFKLMDKELNPIKYLSNSMIRNLIDRSVIKKQGEIYISIQQ